MFWILHKTIWLAGSRHAGAFGNLKNLLLPLLPVLLWLGIDGPDTVLSIDRVEMFDYSNCEQKKKILKIELLEKELFDNLTVCKRMTDA